MNGLISRWTGDVGLRTRDHHKNTAQYSQPQDLSNPALLILQIAWIRTVMWCISTFEAAWGVKYMGYGVWGMILI
jgi:hypothetical protein